MLIASQKLKQKMTELTGLFTIERNIFQKLIIIYKYIKLLNKDPLAKNILQKIFDDTAKVMGDPDHECMDEDEFLNVKGEVIFSKEFWNYYSNLELIYKKMKKLRQCKICDKEEFEDLCKLFSRPYSKKMFELSFIVINSNVFDKLDQECFFDDTNKKTWFDEERSILHINGKRVKINIQDKITNAHKILKYIFITNKNNLEDDFFYSEIAEDEFGELDYKNRKNNWQTYYTACLKIQEKIQKQTDNNIYDFLKFSTGKTGKININKKYINK